MHMKTFKQALLVAGLGATALLISAPQALAISPLSEEQCSQPSASDDDLWESFINFDTSDFSENSCKKLCKGIRKVCLKNGKGRIGCVKDTDKLHFGLERALCGDDKECEATLKEEAKTCSKELKQEAADSKSDCNELESECRVDCEGGLLNPQL
jgi:hypothetical protein